MKDQNRGFPVGAHEPIAIIGMACNLPGGNRTPEAFFDFLLKRKCGIVEIPADRWGVDVYYDADPNAIAKSVTKWAGFVDDLRCFDAKFFGISPREAAAMDPQQRMVLQGAVEAMMDAQIPLDEFSRQSTGVFVGISQSDYRTVKEIRITSPENYAGTGYALCIAANRVSHRLNLTGPSFAVDTACSSSLTALDLAVKNLRAGSCDMALVSGVNAMAHPSAFLAFSKAGMVSPTGRISTFDAAANGFVRGEGMGMIVIKPLSRAQADGDRIHAVIHDTATNQDGATNTITAPSQQAQTAMMRSLLNAVDVSPAQIGFVEAHGTGTPIGDPIEAGAIGTVIGQKSPDHPVFVGSSKANVGHLESGAGITGLIKAAMAVKTGIVPPNIHFDTPNPNIAFDALNLEVPVKPEAFPDTGGPNYAVVNSFGFGGANASALISSPPAPSYDHHPIPAMPVRLDVSNEGFPHIIPISAATPEGLEANAAVLLKSLGAKGPLAANSLGDIAAALATKRSHLMYRAVILARTTAALKSGLRQLAAGKSDAAHVITGQQKTTNIVCFTFSGQGSQWWGMARDLLVRNKTFSDAVDAFDAEFTPVAGWSIRAELLKDQDSSRIDDTTVTQPALFAIQSGLAALWKQLGVTPDMVVGHSIGEAAGSYVAGGLSLSGAAKFLSKRGAIRDQLGVQGAMAAIGLNHLDVEAILPTDGALGIAAINGPGSTTISGDYDALHAFVEEFQLVRPDVFIRTLTVDTAWHSYHLDAGEDWFRREMAKIDWAVPRLPFISTVTAQPETRFDTNYGWLNLRCPVRWQAAVETALDMGANSFLELGPAATLAGPTKSTALEAGATVSVLNSINRKGNDFDAMAHAAAALFVEGVPLNWAVITGAPATYVDLPRNAWIEEPFWQDSEESRDALYSVAKNPFLGRPARGNSLVWNSEINLSAFPYLKDHRLQSDVIFPAAGYLDTMITLCREHFGSDKVIEIEDAVIHEALFIGAEQEVLFSTTYDTERGRIKMYSRIRDADDDWVLRSEARVRMTDVQAPKAKLPDPAARGFQNVDVDHIYGVDAAAGFVNYGEAFQTITELWLSRKKTIARIKLRDCARATMQSHVAHPTLFDGCLQILEPSVTLKKVATGRQPGDPICLPIGIGQMRVYGDFPDELVIEADQLGDVNDTERTVGFTVYDTAGTILMTVDDVRVKLLPSKQQDDAGGDVPPHFVRQELVELRDMGEEPLKGGRWILLDNGEENSRNLAPALTALGADVHCISGDALGDHPGDALVDLLEDDIEAGEISGIIVTWPLDLPDLTDDISTGALFDPLEACIKDIISLGELMDFARMGENGLPDFVFLTKGAYPRLDDRAQDAQILSQMPIAAMVRGLATETPEYMLRIIDTDSLSLEDKASLAAHIMRPTEETELILCDDKRFAPRLKRADLADFDPKVLTINSDDAQTNFHATMKTPGVIDHVGLSEIPLAAVGAGEVRVRVAAVGLNFRDIMAVTGLLPIEAERQPAWENLGLEFGGTVEAVGTGVTQFKPGDRLMGLGKRCLQRFLTIDQRALSHVPDHVSLAEAATIPSAFATAHYALNHVGRMRKGDKVFIHVATGGVGTAAVQLAQAAGAEIFATAGSPAKRKLLRDLGVPHVMDSRSLKFADDVMRITKGKGVDILLNSLPGDYITKGLDIMAPYGRYLEIGKRDVYEDASIGMKALRRNVSLSVLDLAAMGEERPDVMAELFAELQQMLETHAITPLPLTEFPVEQVSDAIRYMSQAKHVGKVVVALDQDSFDVRRDETRPVALQKNGTYLITGGTAGFSLSMADWLSQAGAGHLVLASRSGRLGAAEEKQVTKLRKRGTQVSVEALDITDAGAVDDFVTRTQASEKPLRGVLHGAAVIKDGFANQLSPEMIHDVLAPKIKGGWNLHRALVAAQVDVDFMIGFSSIAQAAGSAGQANYIAGNAFLDALAHYRVGQGQAGTAIDWGVIADAGFVARNAALGSYLESVGQFGLKHKDTGAAMELAVTRAAPSFVYARADWPQIARANPALGNSPRMSGVLQTESGGITEVRARLMELSGDALVKEAEDYIKDEIVSVLKIDKSTIQLERPMSELGLDSLSSFELKIRIETALDTTIPVSKFLQAPAVSELAKILAIEVDNMRKADITSATTGEQVDLGGGATSPHTGAVASNAQLGLIQAACAPMTSAMAQVAMEHVVYGKAADALTAPDLATVMRTLEKRHPLLKMRVDAQGTIHLDGRGISIVEGASTARLDVANGEFARLSLEVKESETQLSLRLHAALGDYASAALLMQELTLCLAGQTPPKALPHRTVMAALAACRFDAEDPDSQRDHAFWWYALTAATAAPVPFAKRSRAVLPVHAGRNHGAAQVVSVVVPSVIKTPTLLCALAHALRDATASGGPMLIGYRRSLRNALPVGAAVGPFEIEQPLLVPHRTADAALNAQFDRICAAAPNHPKIDCYAAAAHMAQYFDETGTTPFQILFEDVQNNLGTPPASLLHDLWVQAHRDGNQTTLRVIFDSDVLNAKMAQDVADGMVTMLAEVELVS